MSHRGPTTWPRALPPAQLQSRDGSIQRGTSPVLSRKFTSIDRHQAIDQQRCPSVSALDNRAATYTKLGDLQAALRDGKEMIHAAKTDVTV